MHQKRMAASRLFTLVGASFCRNRLSSHSNPVFPFYLKPPAVTSIKLVSSSSLTFPRYSSSAGVALEANSSTITSTITGYDDVETSSVILTDHPWPEWVAFVDNLKSKGYFVRNSSTSDVAAGGDDDGGGDVNDLNSLKFACLNFARDRFDIFKSLSKKEIQTLVDKGCPNLFRKAVNSGKRLRSYLQLNEGDVCNVCLLRGSCDRAFYVLKDFEATARTVDIVRLLMLYAIDPLVSSRDVKTPDRVVIEASARKLLTELIELSETEHDPRLIEHDVEVFHKKDQYTNESNENAEMKRGDWMCPQCNFLNFSRNLQCRKCAEDEPRRVGDNEIEMKKGDWLCPKCKYMNFARNMKCLQCKAKGPKSVSFGERKQGDWDCQKCGFMNFANNVRCKRCQDPPTQGRPGDPRTQGRPGGPRTQGRSVDPRSQGRPGDWECPQCRFPNYARNTSCKKCEKRRPATY